MSRMTLASSLFGRVGLGLAFTAVTAAAAVAAPPTKLKVRGKSMSAIFQHKISECTNPDDANEVWEGYQFAQVNYFEQVEKNNSAGGGFRPDVNVVVWYSDPCFSTEGSFVFSADGCTTYGDDPGACWDAPVYTSKSVTVAPNLKSGRVVATVPLYGGGNGCFYSAEVRLDWNATADQLTTFNDVYRYYGYEEPGGPLLQFRNHSQAKVQPASAAGSIKIGAWRNLDGTTSTESCGALPHLPSEWALSNVVWDVFDPEHESPNTAIADIQNAEYTRLAKRPAPTQP